MFATHKSVVFLGKTFTESGTRRDYAVQTVSQGAIEHHFSVFDTCRLWGKGRLCFLYALGHRARIAICNTITGRAGRHYIGILLRSIPHLVRVTEEVIEPLGEVLNGDVTLARQVKIGDQEAWIPDLDNLEADLARILD